MTPVKITCPRCGGSGHAELDAAAHDALTVLRAHHPSTSEEVHTLMVARGYRCTQTATMNQLAKLVRLRLARRNGKHGKSWLYEPVEARASTKL